MLPIKRRIRKESFEKIMREGVFVHSNNLYFKFIDRKDDFISLFGFIVPAKVVKTAVLRHFIKRKMTAVVERVLADIKTGFSCLVFVKKNLLYFSRFEIESEILELLKKAKMLNGK